MAIIRIKANYYIIVPPNLLLEIYKIGTTIPQNNEI